MLTNISFASSPLVSYGCVIQTYYLGLRSLRANGGLVTKYNIYIFDFSMYNVMYPPLRSVLVNSKYVAPFWVSIGLIYKL